MPHLLATWLGVGVALTALVVVAGGRPALPVAIASAAIYLAVGEVVVFVYAAALTSVRSIGTAFGAAIAGVVASMAGLGDATEPEAVGRAVTAVYLFCWVPFGLAAVFMLRFVRVALPGSTRVAATAD